MACRRFRPALDASFVRRIGLAAALHDIGKADVPQAILLKAGPLTARESKVMQLHTVRGAESIAEQLADHPDAELCEMAIEIALTHHGAGMAAAIRMAARERTSPPPGGSCAGGCV